MYAVLGRKTKIVVVENRTEPVQIKIDKVICCKIQNSNIQIVYWSAPILECNLNTLFNM